MTGPSNRQLDESGVSRAIVGPLAGKAVIQIKEHL